MGKTLNPKPLDAGAQSLLSAKAMTTHGYLARFPFTHFALIELADVRAECRGKLRCVGSTP